MDFYAVCECGLEIFIDREQVLDEEYIYCTECGNEIPTDDFEQVDIDYDE